MRAVIVTGTSSGLGKAFFDLLADEAGYFIAIARRFLPEQITRSIEEKDRIILVESDLRELSTLPTVEDLSKLLADPSIDELVFINNAAVVGPIGAIGELPEEQLIEHIQVNTTAAQLLTNRLFSLPQLSRMKITVLNISSGAAVRLKGGWALYCAAKAGNEMFFNVLADQFKDNPNVQVVNVNPGIMDTQMQENIRSASDVHFPDYQRFVAFKEEGKLATPESVALTIVNQYVRGE
ncbi:SDR family NAD(P)-dependent oxidoreductase [Brevibacillus sp. SYSU BS000544]|uniref:SDR family NAD(P)-dependent oxidoreductase n=1 Tax=Brevibacillus sp. SYSU BS000544 TaxID=3416443 RepID=UPI003CE4E33F